MSCASSSAEPWASAMIRARVRYMRPHDATPTVTATLTAMSQILVRMVTAKKNPGERIPRGFKNWRLARQSKLLLVLGLLVLAALGLLALLGLLLLLRLATSLASGSRVSSASNGASRKGEREGEEDRTNELHG